jgi:hypothetical protein
VYVKALAAEHDGTLAEDGVVSPATILAEFIQHIEREDGALLRAPKGPRSDIDPRSAPR